jgi:hypothetical protein
MLLPLPRNVRPFVLDLALMLWTVLELVYLAGLGGVPWLPAHPHAGLEPQARAVALTLLVGRPEVADAGLTRWVFPVWRFSSIGGATGRPDALDVAIAIRSEGCLEPSEERPGRLGPIFGEHAQAVWLARHRSVDEMLDGWAPCIARELATCRERVDPPWTISDVVHLWAHQNSVSPPSPPPRLGERFLLLVEADHPGRGWAERFSDRPARVFDARGCRSSLREPRQFRDQDS